MGMANVLSKKEIKKLEKETLIKILTTGDIKKLLKERLKTSFTTLSFAYIQISVLYNCVSKLQLSNDILFYKDELKNICINLDKIFDCIKNLIEKI